MGMILFTCLYIFIPHLDLKLNFEKKRILYKETKAGDSCLMIGLLVCYYFVYLRDHLLEEEEIFMLA